MNKYMYQGDSIFFRSDKAIDMRDKIATGTYAIDMTQEGELFLRMRNDMSIPEKIYASPDKQADRILNTALSRDGGTGVLLAGEKGSGKTLLGKILTKQAREQGIPTIVINNAFCGDNFNRFIASIQQPCIIFFDEFEKVYDERDSQQKLLTLFDGTYNSQKLFILTTNDRFGINEHMQNRPGRLFYMLEYHGLGEEFIREYCEDNLDNKDHIESVVKLGILFDHFNFDMLQSLVQEMNRYKETVNDALKWLNIQLVDTQSKRYNVEVLHNGHQLALHSLGPTTRFNVMHGLNFDYCTNNKAVENFANKDKRIYDVYNFIMTQETRAENANDNIEKYVHHLIIDNIEDDNEREKADVYDYLPEELYDTQMTIKNLVSCEGGTMVLKDDELDLTVRLSPAYSYSRNNIPEDYLNV